MRTNKFSDTITPHWPQKSIIYFSCHCIRRNGISRSLTLIDTGKWKTKNCNQCSSTRRVETMLGILFSLFISWFPSSRGWPHVQFSTCDSDLTPSLSEQTASIPYNSISAVWHPENTPGGYAVSGCRWRLHVVDDERAAHRSKCERRTNNCPHICNSRKPYARFLAAPDLSMLIRIPKSEFCWITIIAVSVTIVRGKLLSNAIFLAAKISSPANWISLIEHYPLE